MRHQLGGPPSMGADGPPGGAHGRLWHIFSGAGIWAGASPARPAYTLQRSGRRRSGDAAGSAVSRSGYRSDPLPVTSPWLRIFRGLLWRVVFINICIYVL